MSVWTRVPGGSWHRIAAGGQLPRYVDHATGLFDAVLLERVEVAPTTISDGKKAPRAVDSSTATSVAAAAATYIPAAPLRMATAVPAPATRAKSVTPRPPGACLRSAPRSAPRSAWHPSRHLSGRCHSLTPRVRSSCSSARLRGARRLCRKSSTKGPAPWDGALRAVLSYPPGKL